jgi:DNA-binding MarR family transcriptional regulator
MPNRDFLLESFIGLQECGGGETKLDLLSSKGKILAAMLRHNELTVKDIPHLAGVSFRTCFQQLRFLEQIGVIEKSLDPLDKRRAIVKLNRENLSKILPI